MTPRERASRRAAKSAAAQLETKLLPSQERARSTFETILQVTGLLLGEVGVERLSTNMICERAGLTPPALYRWFPNKYAILAELARRLSRAQLEAVEKRWRKRAGTPLKESVNEVADIMRELDRVTRSQPGGVWIMRAMRAVPLLHDIRKTFRERLVAIVRDGLRVQGREATDKELDIAASLMVEAALAANEMATEGDAEDVDAIAEETGWMVALYADKRWGSPM